MLNKIALGDGPRKGANSVKNWNTVVEATNDHLLRKAGGEVLPLDAPVNNWHSIISVRNDIGATLRQGEVVEFDGISTTTLQGHNLTLIAATPDLTRVGWGILLAPLKYTSPAKKVGPCLVVGACEALVDFADAGHKYAKLESGSRVLQSAANGPVRVLWKPSGTGEKKCAVLIGLESLKVYIGKTTGAFNKGATQNIDRYLGGAETDTGINDSVKNLFANISGSGKWVAYVDVDGTFYAIAGEC